MNEKIVLIVIGSMLVPGLISAVTLFFSMRVELAVLKEKTKYLSGQMRSVLRRMKMVDDTGESEKAD